MQSSVDLRQQLGDARLIIVGIGLSAMFWYLEALLHVVVFDDADLVTQMFRPPAHEVWMRLTVIIMFVAFSIYAQWMVAARRRAEDAVNLAHAEQTQIFETAADGMRIVDRNFTVLHANETFARLAGMPKQDIVGRKCYEVFRGHLCDTPGCPINRVLNHEERVEYDAEKERMDGSRVPCIVTATPFRDADGEIIGIVEDFKDITERRQAEQELMESRERLRELTSHLHVVREEERSRIARELHDELGQALTALKMDVHWLNRHLPAGTEELRTKIEAMSQLIGGTVQSVRRICSELRPGLLDDFGLSAAIAWQAEEFSKRTDIPCEVSSEPSDIVLEQDLSIAVFRIFQESLTNIARHAEASRVEVRLKEAGGVLQMTVHDNGRGISSDSVPRGKSFGLIGIRERVHAFLGRFDISSSANGGTTVEVSIPTRHQEERRA